MVYFSFLHNHQSAYHKDRIQIASQVISIVERGSSGFGSVKSSFGIGEYHSIRIELMTEIQIEIV